VLLLGASGTIGQACARALIDRGHDTVCFLRPAANGGPGTHDDTLAQVLAGAELRFGQVTDAESLRRDGLRGERFDAIISCLASRSGVPAQAWAVDHLANRHAVQAALTLGVPRFVLLSAICVQKPRLAFQHAKLAAEQALVESGLAYSIVRPTAFFKSLSGQVARVLAGKPFLLFGDGALTACKPISDRDLAAFMVDCLDRPDRHNRVLPIGGPGAAITPREQGDLLFALTGRAPRFRSVPPAMLRGIGAALGLGGRLSSTLAAKAELARIGHYYATESMLVLDPRSGRYDAAATPSTGTDTLADHYRALIAGEIRHHAGEHAVF
jgi:divinyl chlorophyllide a 8-vinyl-reductase